VLDTGPSHADAANEADESQISCSTNTFTFPIHRISDSRYERTIILSTGGSEGSEGAASEHTHGGQLRKNGRIEWRVGLNAQAPGLVPSQTQTATITIPPECIYLVCE
jgi:hypothetical protein